MDMTEAALADGVEVESLYETDFYGWIRQQARLIRSGELALLDYDNLLEEIEAMGRAEKRSLRSRLTVLLMHLLKWQYQPEHRGKSWRSTIVHQRTAIAYLLADSPRLKSVLPASIASAWSDARKETEAETELNRDLFPRECPWSFEAMMDEDFWPQAAPE